MTTQPLVVVTGKGGTGRTTVAAALGMAAAAEGRRAIVCETWGHGRVPALFGRAAAPPGEEVALEPGLWAMTIDPRNALEEWLGRQLPRRLVHLLVHSGAFGAFIGAAPGARELLTITKAWELGRPERWRKGARPFDVVILDAPASGHGVGLLRTPRTFADIAQVGPIASQARQVDESLSDPRQTACIAVALPGELPVSETLELEDRMQERLGRGLDGIVVNAVWPRRVTAPDLARLAAADGAVPGAAAHAARAAAARVRTQQAQLARLRREARAPVQPLPFVFAEHLGLEDVRRFSERLARAGSDRRPSR
jgi:anion-transporting  ArsA/GET3 family ATPase